MPGATITRGILSAFAGKTSRQLLPLLCLAPHGVFRATPLTRRPGGLLPRLFTLTQHHQHLPAISFRSPLEDRAGLTDRLKVVLGVLMVLGGIFSVTLSVTRDSRPGCPRFHEACRPVVFGLSSGENKCQASDRLPHR